MTRDRALGQYLVDQGWIRADQLAKALSSQAVLGGRVGTCLLEMEALSEDLLMKALAAQSGVPAIGAEELRQIPEDVIGQLPAKIATRLQVIPFRLTLGRLDVVMTDVFDLAAQDELSFVTGKRIAVHVTTEVRLREALDRYYRVECPSRYAHLLDRLNRARYLWSTPSETPTVATSPSASGSFSGVFNLPPEVPLRAAAPRPSRPQRPAIPDAVAAVPAAQPQPVAAPRAREPKPTKISLTAAEREQLQGYGRSRQAAAASPASPVVPPIAMTPKVITFEQWTERLAALVDRDAVAAALLEYLESRVDRAALLMVRMGEVHGWMGYGKGFDERRFRRFRIDFNQPSVFLNLKLGTPYYRGSLAPMASHTELLKCWGGSQPHECLVLPLRIKERLVTFLYTDLLASRPSGFDVDEMQRLTQKAAGAFELCILKNKLKSS